MNSITNSSIKEFQAYLVSEEKSAATVQKYVRDVLTFIEWLDERILRKESVLEYKAYLCEEYAPVSVNAALSSLNSYFAFCGRLDLKVKNLKIQRQIFIKEDKELTKWEYERLLEAAKRNGNQRLCLLMQTICSSGIRASKVKFITVEATSRGYAEINCKGKYRHIFLPKSLCSTLKRYARGNGIKKGPIFVTKNGKPLDRSYIFPSSVDNQKSLFILHNFFE